jgi:hypothetical protein
MEALLIGGQFVNHPQKEAVHPHLISGIHIYDYLVYHKLPRLMKTKLKSGKSLPGDPFTNPKIVVKNTLDTPIHVMILPNEDYKMAEVFMSIASLGSGALGIVSTTSSMMLFIKMLSFIKTEVSLFIKIRDFYKDNSVTIPPGGMMNVYDGYDMSKFKLDLPSILMRVGVKAFTLSFVTDDFKKSVVFNSAADNLYTVHEGGVDGSRWNSGCIPSGKLSSAPPTLLNHNNRLMMFFRDHRKGGERIQCSEYIDSSFVNLGIGYVHDFVDKDGVAAVGADDKVWLFGHHKESTQMFAKEINSVNNDRVWMGIDIFGRPSAVLKSKGKVVAIAKHSGFGVTHASVLENGKHYDKAVEPIGIINGFSPVIHYFKDNIFIIHSEPGTFGVSVTLLAPGNMDLVSYATGVKSSAQVAVVTYKDRMYIFYRHDIGNGISYVWTEDGKKFHTHFELCYLGFDKIEGPPTAAVLPDGSGIMVAGIAMAENSVWDYVLDFGERHQSEAIVYTIVNPLTSIDDKKPKPKKLLAKKTAAKKVVVKRPAKAVKKAAKKLITKKTATKKPMKAVAKTAKKAVASKPKTKVKVAAPARKKPGAKKTARKVVASKPKAAKAKAKVAAPVRKKVVAKKIARKVVASKPKAAKAKAKVAAPVRKKVVAKKKARKR